MISLEVVKETASGDEILAWGSSGDGLHETCSQKLKDLWELGVDWTPARI